MKSYLLTLVLALTCLLFPLPSHSAQGTEDFSCFDLIEIEEPDCQALVALYHSTNGPAWLNNTNWLVTLTPSDWFGVTVNEGHVTQLNLEQNGLSGSLPPDILKLSGLIALNLGSNQLTGVIPSEMGSLSMLQHLFLNDNQLIGTIPIELCSLSNLVYLDLSNNQLNGTIPVELGNLSNLDHLYLDRNQLSGDIPWQLGNLINLSRLYLYDNLLTGPIPPELGSLTKMWNLWLSGNQLEGSIPSELGQLTGMQFLRLAGNQLNGSIPPELGDLTNLWQLSLGDNLLSEPIPPELGSLVNLLSLSLAGNQLSGEIPAAFGSLTNLYELDLSANQLDGPIPAELGNLTYLEVLLLDQNHLSGDIPDSLASLEYLVPPGELEDGGDGLDLDYNALSVPLDYPNLSIPLQLFLSQFDPNWHTRQAIAQVIGLDGGVLASLDNRAVFSIPSGALAGDTIFTYTPQPVPTHEPGELIFTNHSFQLTAADALGNPVTAFNLPVGVTITYEDSDILGLMEDSLALYLWDAAGLAWQDAAGTCEDGTTFRNLASNTFSLDLCHLSDFAVFSNAPLYVFLPFIIR